MRLAATAGPARRILGPFILLACLLGAWPLHAQPELLPAQQAFRLAVDDANPARVVLEWTVAPGYYLYRNRISVESDPPGGMGALRLPPGQRKTDPNFGVVEVYHAGVRVQLDASRASRLRVRWQGCAEAGVCYPPQQQVVAIQAAAAPHPAGRN